MESAPAGLAAQLHATGHASLEGSEDYNLKLSQNRADAMRDAPTIGGVTSSRVHTFALGEYAPAVPESPIERYTPCLPLRAYAI